MLIQRSTQYNLLAPPSSAPEHHHGHQVVIFLRTLPEGPYAYKEMLIFSRGLYIKYSLAHTVLLLVSAK